MASTKAQRLASIRIYWDVRDELSELNGILRGERILIPTYMRKDMLEKVHRGHMGIEKSKRRARDVLYWPGMNSEIQDKITFCRIRQQHQKQISKEPMMPSQLPSKPSVKVPTNLFTWDKSEYLLIDDYHSRFVEVVKLPDTKSTTVITHIKSALSRYGIPSEVISDNGPRPPQRYLIRFTHKQTESSLGEKSVQTVKNLLIKVKQDNRDPCLGLLEYRNIPIDDVGSPAQLWIQDFGLQLILSCLDD